MPRHSKGSKPMAAGAERLAVPATPAPGVSAGRSWRQRLREFRFLTVILSASLGLALYESSRNDLPHTITEVPPVWLMNDHLNMAQTLTELYPERSYGYFLRSYQAAMCWDQRFAPPVCEPFPYKDLRDVRSALEEAIARGGAADQEELFHFYAYILVLSNEPPEVVDAAIRRWRRHYPHSKKPDPRQMAFLSN